MHTKSRFSTTAAAGAVLGVAVLGGAPALAAWAKPGTGDGAAKSKSLAKPLVSVARDATNPGTKLKVTWTATDQLAGARYTVFRDGTAVGNCTDITVLACEDAGRSPRTSYKYVVRAKLGTNWVKDSDEASASTVGLALAAPSSVTAGTATSGFVVTTVDAAGNIVNGLGARTLSWTGSATDAAPNGQTASLPATSASTNGTLYRAISGGVLTVTDAGDLGSATASVSVDAAAPARLVLKGLVVNGSPQTCTVADCGPYVLGNGATASTSVELWDAYENVAKAASQITVTVTKTNNSSNLNPNPQTPQNIAVGGTGAGPWTYTAPAQGNYSDAVTFSAGSGGPSSVILRFKRQP